MWNVAFWLLVLLCFGLAGYISYIWIQIDALNDELENQTKEQKDQHLELQDLQKQLKGKEQTIERKDQEIQQKQTELGNLKEEVEEKEEQFQNVQSRLDSSQAELDETKNDLHEAREELETLQKQLDQKEKQLKKAQQKRKEAEEKAETFQQKYSSAEDELSETKEELEDVRDEVKKYKRKLRLARKEDKDENKKRDKFNEQNEENNKRTNKAKNDVISLSDQKSDTNQDDSDQKRKTDELDENEDDSDDDGQFGASPAGDPINSRSGSGPDQSQSTGPTETKTQTKKKTSFRSDASSSEKPEQLKLLDRGLLPVWDTLRNQPNYDELRNVYDVYDSTSTFRMREFAIDEETESVLKEHGAGEIVKKWNLMQKTRDNIEKRLQNSVIDFYNNLSNRGKTITYQEQNDQLPKQPFWKWYANENVSSDLDLPNVNSRSLYFQPFLDHVIAHRRGENGSSNQELNDFFQRMVKANRKNGSENLTSLDEHLTKLGNKLNTLQLIREELKNSVSDRLQSLIKNVEPKAKDVENRRLLTLFRKNQ